MKSLLSKYKIDMFAPPGDPSTTFVSLSNNDNFDKHVNNFALQFKKDFGVRLTGELTSYSNLNELELRP